MSYFIPLQAQEWIKEKMDDIDNFHLLFNRFLEFKEDKFVKPMPKTRVEEFSFSAVQFETLAKRARTAMEAIYGDEENCSRTLTFQTTERLILGAASVLENSLRLNHIWGFPFAPGTSVKGVVRSYVIDNLFGQNEEEAWLDESFCLLFGCPEDSILKKAHKGRIVFFDALPMAPPKLKVDVMNPHYQDYYHKEQPVLPADYLSPTPIFFLTIDRGNIFQFCFATTQEELLPEKSTLVETAGSRSILDITEYFIAKTLEESGLGAKTAVEYGLMKRKS